ncbi:MAG: hypothetical protein IKT00_14085 [Prevotella sp.]|nr:hypothetical protein [Prevotella sp.]
MEELIKHRSIKSCIAAAWHTWRDDARTILRSTGLPILVTAAMGALHSLVHLSDATMTHFRETQPILSILLMGLAAVGMVVGMIWILSRLFNFLNQKGRGYNKHRSAVNILGYLVASTIIMAIVIGILTLLGIPITHTQSTTEASMLIPEGSVETKPFAIIDIPWWIWHICGGVLILVLLLPLTHHGIRYQMEPDTRYIHHLGKGLRDGVKNWGGLLGTSFVAALVLSLVSIIPTLPLLLLHIAEGRSTVGVIDGDPSGMPTSIPWLYALTSFVVGIIMLYIWQIFLLAQTFAVMRLRNDVPPQFPTESISSES